MKSVVESFGRILAGLSQSMGFWGSFIFYVFIGVLALYPFIKREYNNVILSKILREDYMAIRAKFRKKPDEASPEEATFLLINHYDSFAQIWSTLMKLLLSAIYGFALASPLMSEYTSKFSFSTSDLVYKVLQDNHDAGLYFFILIGVSGLLQYYNSGTLSHTLVKTDLFGVIAVIGTILGCVFLPAGGAVMVGILTLVQNVSTILNLTIWKNKNIAKLSKKKAVLKEGAEIKTGFRKKKKK